MMYEMAQRYVTEGWKEGRWLFVGGQPGSGKTHIWAVRPLGMSVREAQDWLAKQLGISYDPAVCGGQAGFFLTGDVIYRDDELLFQDYDPVLPFTEDSLLQPVKELLQEYFTPENLVTEVRRLLEDTSYQERMLLDYAALRQQLGGGNVSEAVAASMIEELR